MASLWEQQKHHTEADQLFLNLINNSLDAMSDGGEIQVRTVVEGKTGKAQRIVVDFVDTGSGMTREVMSRMFDPLYTTKEAIARRALEDRSSGSATRGEQQLSARYEQGGLLGRSPVMIGLYKESARGAYAVDHPDRRRVGSRKGISSALDPSTQHTVHRFICGDKLRRTHGTLLEAELFGHVRGAFTGAVSDRKGLWEEAAATKSTKLKKTHFCAFCAFLWLTHLFFLCFFVALYANGPRITWIIRAICGLFSLSRKECRYRVLTRPNK